MSYTRAYTLYKNAQKEDNTTKSLDLYIECLTMYIDIYKKDTDFTRRTNMHVHILKIMNEAEEIKKLMNIKNLPSV